MDNLWFIIIAVFLVVLVALALAILLSVRKNEAFDEEKIITKLSEENERKHSILRQELTTSTQQSVKSLGDMISENQKSFSQNQQEKLNGIEERLKTFSLENEQKLENIRATMEKKIGDLTEDNSRQLEKRVGRYMAKVPAVHKAVVKLKEGYSIDLFGDAE